ncbi:PQQ-binding-like beta-propeller repeat protein [Halobaculum sp. MBLA0143]|uniref:PQQ-binding-like beta-propeller repeat protein n=1 Tax=Halobaculum sp. MBLA0143 TaxID=3079933 RepID=UPI0035243802
MLNNTRRDERRSRLVAHDQSGERLWHLDLPRLTFHLAAVGDLLYVTHRDGVVAYSAT